MQPLHAFPDLFVELYEGLAVPSFREDIDRWLADQRLVSVSLAVQHDVEMGRTTPDRERLRLSHDNEHGMRFAILRGLDRAFAHVNPAQAGAGGAPALRPLALEVAARHRLDSGAHGGALLPRLARPGIPAQLPDHPREAFEHVIRVPPHAWDACEHLGLGVEAQIHRNEIQRGLRVACAPFIAAPEELEFSRLDVSAGSFYRIRPKELNATLERIEAVLERMDASGARIGMVPELTLTPGLLERWQAILRSRERGASRLQMVLVGSGDLGGERRPTNTAVLLNARTGEVIATQRKLYPFNLGAEELERWKLTDLLGKEAVDEDLHPGERLRILEAGAVRLAVLVCEDLGRVADLAQHVRDFGVSHVLVPVFARPTKDRRWERAAADVHARATGSTIVVANSLVMQSIMGSGAGTSLVVWPGSGDAAVGRCDHPDEVACFDLLPDGTARGI